MNERRIPPALMRITSAPSSSKRLRVSGDRGSRLSPAAGDRAPARGVPAGARCPTSCSPRRPARRPRRRSEPPACAGNALAAADAERLQLARAHVRQVLHQRCRRSTAPARRWCRSAPGRRPCTARSRCRSGLQPEQLVARCWKLPMPAGRRSARPACAWRARSAPHRVRPASAAGTTSTLGPLPSTRPARTIASMSCGMRSSAMLAGSATEISSSV